MAIDPTERARRAVLRALAEVTELVVVTDGDPMNTDSFPNVVRVTPDDIFANPIYTFARVGVTNSDLMDTFWHLVRSQLPTISSTLAKKQIPPDVAIGLVRDYVTRVLVESES